MALDWYILPPEPVLEAASRKRKRFSRLRVSTSPDEHVAMDEETHHAVMSRYGNLRFLRRAKDYYEDAIYSPDEVEGLLNELASIGTLKGAWAGLQALCAEAKHRGHGMVAVAD